MKLIATAKIDGPEAKGNIELYELDGVKKVVFTDGFWVAPGAPDVTLALTEDQNGKVLTTNIDIGRYYYNKPNDNIVITPKIDIETHHTFLVYCKKFTAHFGHGRFVIR